MIKGKTSLNALCVNYYSDEKYKKVIFYIECHIETERRRSKRRRRRR